MWVVMYVEGLLASAGGWKVDGACFRLEGGALEGREKIEIEIFVFCDLVGVWAAVAWRRGSEIRSLEWAYGCWCDEWVFDGL